MLKIKNDLTPTGMSCGPIFTGGCPAIFELENGSILVIGRAVSADQLPREIVQRIGPAEIAVEIPRSLLDKS